VPACKRDADPSSPRSGGSSPHALGHPAADVVLADVDGDARLDAIVCGAERGQLTVLRGDGRGGFVSRTSIADAPGLHSLVAGDLDRDGDVDLVGMHHDSFDVHVLVGDGLGGFAIAAAVPARTGGKPHTHGLALADFDADGDLDALTSDQDAGSVALLLGDGRGGLALAEGSPWAIGNDPYPPAIGDIDGDGHLDVVAPLVRMAAVGVLRGNGGGSFTAAPGAPGPLAERPLSLSLGDVTGDGRVDAVVAHDDTSIATVLVGDGEGGFTKSSVIDFGARSFDLELVAFDGDATLDLLATRLPVGVTLLAGDGRGGFAAMPGSPFECGREPAALATGDLDGDGDLDLVLANLASEDLCVLLRG
jgi:hypothetical protein